jgi:hypothetical protein
MSYYTLRLTNALAGRFAVAFIPMRQLIPTFLYPGRSRVGSIATRLEYDSAVKVLDGIDWYWAPILFRDLVSVREPHIPWLPDRLTRKVTVARNYWPHQLVRKVRDAGYEIVEIGYFWPVLEQYPWLPRPMIRVYQRYLERPDDVPVLRKFGLSTLVVGRKA